MQGSAFLSLLILVAIHLFANQSKVLGWMWHGRFLSLAAGISLAYVFVELLPTLEKGQPFLRQSMEGVVPYLDRHAYLIALLGLLFFYGLETGTAEGSKSGFWLSMAGYVLFNFFVGASLSDSSNPDIQPIALFTCAMGMHYFVRDHNAEEANVGLYEQRARWLLVGALFLGYGVGRILHIPDAIVAACVSFVGGGVILNVLHYELPKREKVGYCFFALGALVYAAVSLRVGAP